VHAPEIKSNSSPKRRNDENKQLPTKGGGTLRFVMRKVKLILSLLVMIFAVSALSAYNLYVDAEADPEIANGTDDYPYVHIQDAIDHAFDDSNFANASSPNVRVIVMGIGDYIESLVVNFRNSNGGSHLVQHLTLCSDTENNNQFRLKIPTESSTAIDVIGDNDAVFVMDGLWIEPITSDIETIGINITNTPLLRLEVKDCRFVGLCSSFYISLDDELPMGSIIVDSSKFEVSNNPDFSVGFFIRGYYACESLTINNNTVDNYGDTENVSTSAIHADNIYITNNLFSHLEVSICGFMPTFSTAVVEGNIFRKSTLCMWQRLNTQIKNNLFQYNIPGSSALSSIIMMNDNSTSYAKHKISNNIFTDTQNVLLLQTSANINHRVDVSIASNSFLQCDSVVRMYYNDDSNSSSDRISVYRNNLFVGESSNPFIILDTGGEAVDLEGVNRIPVAYSHFTTPLVENASLNIDTSTVSYGDPLISIDNENLNYDPIWNETVKSPLINAGCPEIDGEPQYDPDGTPPDIGAVYYPHHHQEYFQIGSASSIYWLSFPVVDDRTNTNGSLYWNELGQMFSEHMQGPPDNFSNLNNIGWSYDLDAATMYHQNSIWLEEGHLVGQPKGYKVQFNSGVSNCAVVVDGFKADPNTTPVSWVVVNNQNQPFENWIGYFVTKTNRAGDALSRFIPGSTSYTYLDYVHTIKTQTWVTSRISEEIGSRWIVNPNSYTLSEGQMVALLLLPNAPREMYWNTEYPPVAPIVRPRAAAFDYEEKLDYTPVFLEFDPEDMPAEVGLYVNGVCKGAAVVDTTTVDVALYLDDAKDGGELQIMFYYEGKGKKAAKGWKVYNPESLVFEDTGLRAEQIGKYAYLSFTSKEGDSPVPLITQLDQNYPNPFNPSTSISFVLAKDMSARLDIYNVRGQKVSTLCNSELTKGKHTLQWNGVDAQGRKVASGIYFSRLQTPEGSFTSKMMLMK